MLNLWLKMGKKNRKEEIENRKEGRGLWIKDQGARNKVQGKRK